MIGQTAEPSTMRYLRLILCSILLPGCASSGGPTIDFDTDRNLTQVASAPMVVGRVDMSGGLASGQRVTMQAFGECEGEHCVPSKFEVAFLNNSGQDLNLDYRRVQLLFSGRTLDWEDAGRLDEPEYFLVPRGEFIRVPLSESDFRALAAAGQLEVVFGLTGTTRITVPRDRLGPLRELLLAVDAPA